MEVGGEAGQGVGGWCKTMAGAGGGGFELGRGEDAQGAGVAGGEMLLDSLLLGEWEFSVDEGVECVRIEMFGRLIGLGRLSHTDSPRCGCRSWRRVRRAREMRDMTVPMGTSRIRAMSLYLISSTSQRRSTSRRCGWSCSRGA